MLGSYCNFEFCNDVLASFLQMRHTRKEALKNADLVILAGAVCDFRLSYGRSLPKKGKIIVVNRDKQKMLMVIQFSGTFGQCFI